MITRMTDTSRRHLSATARRRILVIDRDIELHGFLTMVLEGDGYMVFSALTAGDGLDLMDVIDPDLVLLEADTPGADALEFARAVRQREQSPAVIVLADDQPNEADLALAAEYGLSGIVVKPFAIVDLLTSVARVMRPRPEEPLN